MKIIFITSVEQAIVVMISKLWVRVLQFPIFVGCTITGNLSYLLKLFPCLFPTLFFNNRALLFN